MLKANDFLHSFTHEKQKKIKMAENSMKTLAITLITLVMTTIILVQNQTSAYLVKTEVFLSPEIVVEPGLGSNKNYFNIDFPRGHVAIKSLNAELVDGRGNPVPLYEAYLHHWVMQRYYATKNFDRNGGGDFSIVRNSGICDTAVTQYFGLGAETRKTATDIPHPYGIQVGDPAVIPAGYVEGWLLNVHAIDTRGAENKMGCAECRCSLYGVVGDEDGVGRPSGYKGGVLCCPDERRCKLKRGFHGEKRSIYLKYTVKYVDWDSTLMVPLKIYILDITDNWIKGDESNGIGASHHCTVEYDVESCNSGVDKNDCVDSRILSVSLPSGGDVIYGVGHQHAGAIGTTLYGEGGRTICSSNANGEGNEAGNEGAYIVGMTTCYPSPAEPVKISAGETLTLVSNYSTLETHIGVMTLFYLLLADSAPQLPQPPASKKTMKVPKFVWLIVILGIVLVLIVVVASKGKIGKAEGYKAMI